MKLMVINVVYILTGILVLYIVYRLVPTATLFQVLLKLDRRAAGLEVYQVQVDDFQIEYSRGGQGAPLLLLHGFGADKDNWNRVARYLKNHYDVIAIDLPGFGNSSKNIDSDYDVFSQIARVKQLMDRLSIGRFHIAGNSMGGYIAGNFAALYPERVETLLLLNPFGVVGSQTSEMFVAVKQGGNPVVLPRNQDEFKQLFNFLFVSPPFVPSAIVDFLGQQVEQLVPLNTKIFNQIHQMNKGEPQPESPLNVVLKDYKASVLVMWGQKDRVLHASGAEVLKKELPQAKIVVMSDIGHLPMVESPKHTAEEFLLFTRQS
jgi:pimeloyl-ACP methyl ester carboxylesterase